MKSPSFTLIFPLLALVQFSQGQIVYKDKNALLGQRVSDLLGRMTIEEKIQQLNQLSVGVNLNPNNKGETVDDVAPRSAR